MSHVRTDRRGSFRVLLASATAAVTFGIVIVGVGAGSAGATTPSALRASTASVPATKTAPTYDLTGVDGSVKTSDGLSWSFQPSAYIPPPSEDLAISSMNLTRDVTTGGTGYESHLWDFVDTPAIFAFHASTKTAVLNTGTQENPVADVDMTFKWTSSQKNTCTSGSETTYHGSMTGSYSLVTGLTGGGTLSSSDLSIPGAILTADNDCVTSSTTDCPSEAGTSFASNSTPGLFADGATGTILGTALDFVSVARFTNLSAPAEATRGDIDSIDVTPPTYKNSVFSVTTSSAGLVTGSATLTGGKATTVSTPCTSGGKNYTVKTLDVQKATYTSPAGSPIKSKPALGPVITAPSPAKTGSYDVTTVTAA